MSIEKDYKKKLESRESTREVVQEIMDVVWHKIGGSYPEDQQRRVLTSLITELQIALKDAS